MANRNASAGARLGMGLLAMGLFAAPGAHADLEELFTEVFDPSTAADPAAAIAADPAAATTPTADSIPMTVEGPGAGQPIIDISVGGQPAVPVAVDTGSRGLVMPIGDLNPADVTKVLEHFTFSDIDFGAFPAGFQIGLAVPTTVDFGQGIVDDHAVVDGVVFSFPLSAIAAQGSFAPVEGILGIGPNAGGATHADLITADLPGDLGKGVLIDEPDGRLIFGEQPDEVDGAAPIATLSGAPFPGGVKDPQDLEVHVAELPTQHIPVIFDTGGKGGWLPATVYPQITNGTGVFGLTQVPDGVPISVSTADGTQLYSSTTTEGLGSTLVVPAWFLALLGVPDNLASTGNYAFLHNPVYISNDDGGAMTFYGPSPSTPQK